MSFQKLTTACLQKLRPGLLSHFPYSAQILNIVDLYLKGVMMKKCYQTDIYGIPGTEIINVIWTPTPTNLEKLTIDATGSLLYHPPLSAMKKPTKTQDIVQAFKNLIKWENSYTFESVPHHFVPHMEELIYNEGGTVKAKTAIALLYLPRESFETLNTNCEKFREQLQGKFEVDKLTIEHAYKMHKYWKYSSGHEPVAEGVTNFGCAMGAFRNGTRTSDDLVSWTMLLQLGTLCNLYTMDDARGYNLGRWTYEESCKELIEEHEITPVCEVELDNPTARILFERAGMKLITDTRWIHYLPPVTKPEKPKKQPPNFKNYMS